jgi:glycosyltransferase involved in cell wall biosynthesis
VFDVTAILTAHSEGALGGPSLISFEEAIDFAKSSGLSVESLVVLDCPDESTLCQFADVEARGHRLLMTQEGDPGQARNAGVNKARGDFVAFLDGDDLWSANWLALAHSFCGNSAKIVAHSEVNVVFGLVKQLWWHADSEATGFDAGVLRIGNYWDAMSYAARSIFAKYPFVANDVKKGFGHEDWHWNCVTLAAGISHRPVPGSVHFKRRRGRSQMTLCEENDVVTWPHPLSAYEWQKPLSKMHDTNEMLER